MPLNKVKKATSCVIEQLPDIKLLNALGLREGVTVRVVTSQPFGGPIVVQLGKSSIAVARGVAEQIEVKEVL
ncbi:FeoA family protein [Dethiobacter alkaliphilus]|uniref:FeoA family protein n=1 Tax=Dethiobacter alkaliphilus AHT 1 TaxID=555088 RepID=C0GC64_DETAL|nr:FeoA family protein [Dethiobacter alkaliphilus]EEG78799.1 FeoA family protein [Dethiobacter alkaliphilus AHT 1]